MANEKLNDKAVAGVDSDGDGIRDDIQRWINEEFADKPKAKMTMKQVAMGLQLNLLSVANKDQSIIASNRYLNDLTCLDYTIGIERERRFVKK